MTMLPLLLNDDHVQPRIGKPVILHELNAVNNARTVFSRLYPVHSHMCL